MSDQEQPSSAWADDSMRHWYRGALDRGGSFTVHIVSAAMAADPENYRLIRPVMLKLKEKYPEFEKVGETF